MKSTITWLIIVIIIVVGGWLLLTPSDTPTEEGPIKIGFVGPLTGDVAFIGEGIVEAIEMAQEDLEDTKYTYEVVFEDDQLDPKMTASAVNKLISVDKVDAVISISSGAGNVVSPIAEENKVLHLGMASDANVAKGEFNFIHWTPPSEENRVFVEELNKREIKKLGLFTLNQQGVIAIVEDLKEKLEGTDIEIVNEQKFNFGETDFKSLISKMSQSDAEIYLLMAFSPEMEILARQIKESGSDIPLTSIEAFEITEQRDLFEGEWYVNAADATGEFVERFEARTAGTVTLGSPNGYDTFAMIVAAAEMSDSRPGSEEIASNLLKLENFSGAMGPLEVGDDGIVVSEAVVRMIKDGKPVTISE